MELQRNCQFDVAIIGAGPAGSIAAALLARQGYSVVILEREIFPRFSIGESLLPQCMEMIEQAGMLDAVNAAGYQKKNGAAFTLGDTSTCFDFCEQYTDGWSSTYQVPRAHFDMLLAGQAVAMGVDIRYSHSIQSIDLTGKKPLITAQLPDGKKETLASEFLLDASGFGRVIPRLLDLETPTDFPTRMSIFCHLQDNIDSCKFDRGKILITIHPENNNVWLWLIPFSDGRSSFGAVAEPNFFDRLAGDATMKLKTLTNQIPSLNSILEYCTWDTEACEISGYAKNVRTLCTDKYALLGNAGEFLDPVFSSGVTIAMKSAAMAAELLNRKFAGEDIDWQAEFERPLRAGINTFKTFVHAWYSGKFQDIIFHEDQTSEIREMICSILAGYVWDQSNPYVNKTEHRLAALWKYCAETSKNH